MKPKPVTVKKNIEKMCPVEPMSGPPSRPSLLPRDSRASFSVCELDQKSDYHIDYHIVWVIIGKLRVHECFPMAY